MDTNRSFLDNLNAGRKRRSGTALDHISQTLQEIERQLDRAYAARTTREAVQPAAERTAHDTDAEAPARDDMAAQHDDQRTLRELASRLKESAGPDAEPAPSAQPAVRRDHGEPEVSRAPSQSDVAYELERLSAEVAALGERRDERTLNLLRLDMEQLRSSLDTLAREETVRLVGRRWEELAAGQGQFGEDSVAPIATRLEEIAAAVQQLPDTQSLRSLEQKVRGLAGALDQFIEHSSQSRPDLHELIEDRLDEISRAIAATAAAKTPPVDTQHFERIEARIASLSRQVEEVVEETQSAQLVARLDALAHKVEEIGERIDLPADAIREMAAQIASISQKVDEAVGASEPDEIYHEIERRFAGLSQMMMKSHGEALEQGERLFEELRTQMGELSRRLDDGMASDNGHEALMATFEARFDALSAKLDAQMAPPADEQVMMIIEERLEGLAERLKESVEQAASLDPQIVRQLQEQIGALADHLARSGEASPDFEDLGPRLTRIERSLAENHESVLDAARRAAEEALASLREGAETGGEGIDLSAEIRSLEELARRSDDRNARTFEAIHDTLIKIVERLSSMEMEDDDDRVSAVKLAVGAPPSLDPADEDAAGEIEADTIETTGMPAARQMADLDAPSVSVPQKRTPAEAAAAAAEAALSDPAEEEEVVVQREKRSMLGGLTRAFGARREREPVAVARKEPAVEDEMETAVAETALDDELANEPLEPGSGAPDLNAIMRRVRDEGGSSPRHAEGDAAKADFIAAARRAAQAAAAEAETLKRKKSGDARGSQGRFSVSGLLRARKKTALLAVAAIAVAAGGVGAAKLMDPATRQPAKVAAVTPHVTKVEKAEPVDTAANLGAEAAPTATAQAATGASEAKVAAARNVDSEISAPAVEKDTAADAPVVKASLEVAPAPSSAAAPDHVASAVTAPVEHDVDAAPAADTTEVASISGDDGAASVSEPQAADAEPQTVSLEAFPAAIGTTELRKAAAEGDPKALFAVADRYAQGAGVEADPAIAARYYTQAAEKGLAPAQYRIGNDYEKGIGVERDIAKAKSWYAKAADQGNASAMHNLGVLYAMGAEGGSANEKAVSWFSRAADLGVKDSQFNLGILAAKGVGMKRDLAEAYKWFALVAKTGDTDAAAKRDEVAKALDADALKAAKASTELWKAKPLDRAANVVDLPAEWTPDKTTTASVDMKKAVTNIQLILNKNGYSAGPADGVMGGKTKSAIVAFQKDNGLDATGEVDPKLVQALLAHND